MSEQHASYLYVIREAGNEPEYPVSPASPPFSPHTTLDLGRHTVELLDEQAILLVDNETAGERETAQLDREETYRLFITLWEVFQEVSVEVFHRYSHEKAENQDQQVPQE